jgi:hypothetical protein
VHRFRLDPHTWRRPPWTLDVRGLEQCRELLGA